MGVDLRFILLFICILLSLFQALSQQRNIESFNNGWKFFLGNDSLAFEMKYNDNNWRKLNLPHDWSIEGVFSKDEPCKTDGGALPTGIGWYRKVFTIPQTKSSRNFYIDFDGVHRNSEVWINGHYLGIHPYGYSSFRYDLTPWLKFGNEANTIALKVDNSAQPNSRYYTGSGIYRNVWLTETGKVYVDHWGTFITTSIANTDSAIINIDTKIQNLTGKHKFLMIQTVLFDQNYTEIATLEQVLPQFEDSSTIINQTVTLPKPNLWSVDNPFLYKAISIIICDGKVTDSYETNFGIRNFRFDAQKGFFLNEKPLKILGVCNHHDLGALGAAFNTRAAERQLEILKAMGCNALRTAHNPPAPELLVLCDRMGFIVMDESFDMWRRKKNKQDYHKDFVNWHKVDLEAMVLRDRNHPSVFMWSIGNEIPEQFDSTGITITKELVDIVKNIDNTRPVTSALTENIPEKNNIWKSGALDILGFNYKEGAYNELPQRFPNQKFIITESNSVFATRGHYDMPSDSIRLWPPDSKTKTVKGNPDFTVSAYDHVMAYWGATHEKNWKIVKDLPHLSGMFIWSGFDFIGEPIPYPWPARSSYYGIIDLCGFPKDAYYFYQSEWTNKPMLHLFPHWNWKTGDTVDVWAYYNSADNVELFLNGRSLGVKGKTKDSLHIMWRVPFEAGTLKAITRKGTETIISKEIKTAGIPYKIELSADRSLINADSLDLSFITIRITDKDGNMVPDASNLVNFDISGEGFIAGVDNGYQASIESFKDNKRKAFNGMCLAILQSNGKKGKIVLKATADGLKDATIKIKCK